MTANVMEASEVSVRRKRRPSVSRVFEAGGLLLLLVALLIFFGLNTSSRDTFFSSANLSNLLGNQSVTGIIAIAMVIPLVSGYFDLSVAAVAGLTNVTVAAALSGLGASIPVAILLGMAVAVVCGLVNALLVATLKLNGFVVTLGTYTLIGGVILFFTGGQTIYQGIPIELGSWGTGKVLGIPIPFYLLIAVALVAWYLLMQTPFGRRLESIGTNEKGARLVGVRVDRSVFISFLLSAVFAGVAGVLLTSRSGGADPNAAPAYLFPALTAVFLGATAIRPGKYNVWGTIIGVFLIAVAINGLTLSGADTWITPVFNGLALVLAVAVSTLLGRRQRKTERRSIRAADRDEEEAEVDANTADSRRRASQARASD